MATLKRDFLRAFGIEEDKIEQILDKHKEVLDEIIEERDSLRESAKNVDGIQKQLDEANKKIKELEEAGSDEVWQKKYNEAVKGKEKAEQELKDYKTEISNKEAIAKKTENYKNLLKETGISEKRLNSILKVTDLSGIEVDKDGNFKDADALKETIQNEWSDFIVKDGKEGAQVSNPPASGGGSQSASRASQLAKSYYEDLYGSVKED